ncbi:MAG: response regulator transcription factor [Chloroflexi bacterium]|nr:response regulator transcription factor [Chloroflexota bacterium]
MERREPLRVILVDDHELVRVGLRTLFNAVPTIDVVAEADSVASALEAIDATGPDLVILDLRLPDGSGIELCQKIRRLYPMTRVLVLTAFDDEILSVIQAGASGYILKKVDLRELLHAIEVIGRGEAFLCPIMTRKLFDLLRQGERRQTPETDLRLAQLTGQEYRILGLIAEGKTNREIGAVLSLSEHTVKIYVSGMLGKLGFRRRAQAAAFIAQHQRVS